MLSVTVSPMTMWSRATFYGEGTSRTCDQLFPVDIAFVFAAVFAVRYSRGGTCLMKNTICLVTFSPMTLRSSSTFNGEGTSRTCGQLFPVDMAFVFAAVFVVRY